MVMFEVEWCCKAGKDVEERQITFFIVTKCPKIYMDLAIKSYPSFLNWPWKYYSHFLHVDPASEVEKPSEPASLACRKFWGFHGFTKSFGRKSRAIIWLAADSIFRMQKYWILNVSGGEKSKNMNFQCKCSVKICRKPRTFAEHFGTPNQARRHQNIFSTSGRVKPLSIKI